MSDQIEIFVIHACSQIVITLLKMIRSSNGFRHFVGERFFFYLTRKSQNGHNRHLDSFRRDRTHMIHILKNGKVFQFPKKAIPLLLTPD